MAETCDPRQTPALNPNKGIIQARDFSLIDVNAQSLSALCRTLDTKRPTPQEGVQVASGNTKVTLAFAKFSLHWNTNESVMKRDGWYGHQP